MGDLARRCVGRRWQDGLPSKVFEEAQSQLYYPAAGAYGLVGANPETNNPGKPTFIMVGQETYFGTSVDDPPFFKIIILTSFDGESWQESFSEKKGWGYAAAWDEANKRFLAQCVTDVAPDAYKHSVFASADGSDWSRIETSPGAEAGPAPQPSPLMMATGTPLVKDTLGNIVPNGSYYGKNANYMIIKPKVLAPYYGSYEVSEPVASVDIIKTDPETGQITQSIASLPFPVSSVAYAGGIYQACGGTEALTAKIASSSDDGQSWNTDLSVAEHQAICVMAGPELAK